MNVAKDAWPDCHWLPLGVNSPTGNESLQPLRPLRSGPLSVGFYEVDQRLSQRRSSAKGICHSEVIGFQRAATFDQ
jgi:hypothetical protein